jgi:hypothetical protein
MRKIAKKSTKEVEDETYKKKYKKEVTSKQNRQKVKKRKSKIRKQKKMQIPEQTNPEEQNKIMKKGRIPRIRERSHKKEIHLYKK